MHKIKQQFSVFAYLPGSTVYPQDIQWSYLLCVCNPYPVKWLLDIPRISLLRYPLDMYFVHPMDVHKIFIFYPWPTYWVRFRVNAKVERSVQREETLTRKQTQFNFLVQLVPVNGVHAKIRVHHQGWGKIKWRLKSPR